MNSLDLRFTLDELALFVGDGFVDNLYLVGNSILLIRVRRRGVRTDIVVEPPLRIHSTMFEYEKPRFPPSFCTSLRRHLVNGRIVGISQHRFERIAILSIATSRGVYKVYVELFREGNVILVDPNGRIIDAMRKKRMKDRVVAPGVEFKLPPPVGLDPFSDSLDSILASAEKYKGKTLAAWMALALGVPSPYSDDLLAELNLSKDSPLEEVPRDNLYALVEALRKRVKSVKPPFRGYVYLNKEGHPVDFSPFKLKVYGDLEVEEYDSFNEALDEYFHRIAFYRASSERDRVQSRLARRLVKEISRVKSRISELEARAVEYKRIGDILYSRLTLLDTLASNLLESKRKGLDENSIVEEASKLASNLGLTLVRVDFDTGRFEVKVNECTVSLSFLSKVYESIESYYKASKKASRRAESLKLKLKELEKELEKVRSEGSALKPLTLVRRRRRRWYEKFRFFHSSEGFLIVAGRDASTNELLIKKYTEPEDLVFHADIYGAPFVVVKTGGGTPSEQTLREAAIFAASYSRAWRDGLRSLDVFYVKPSQLSKAPPPGQFLPRGSFRVLGSKTYLRDAPLELAVGLTLSEDGRVDVMVAPEDAVKAKTRVYVKIAPGPEGKRRLAEQIAASLKEKARKIFGRDVDINISELVEKLPLGGGRILDGS